MHLKGQKSLSESRYSDSIAQTVPLWSCQNRNNTWAFSFGQKTYRSAMVVPLLAHTVLDVRPLQDAKALREAI